MPDTRAEVTTAPEPPLIGTGDLDPQRILQRRPGRNRTKADVLFYDSVAGRLAVKDYSSRPWLVRQTLGRTMIRRETAAYAHVAGLDGFPRFFGRLSPFSLATRWVEGRPLSELPEGGVSPTRFDELGRILDGLHERGVALTDLSHRDVLLSARSIHIVDLAAAFVLGRGAGRWRRRLFERFRGGDRFALARLRARFTGEDPAAVIAATDPRVLAWHRRGRRIKWCWDRLRGARRVPPVDDHWRF